MKIFLSYASEDRELADQTQLALTGAGHHVFFDSESLPSGGDYHPKIRTAVEDSDIFVFLITNNSIAPGSYTLTELKYARNKWAHPKGRVLPVLAEAVVWEMIPTYLKAVTVLKPEGNIPAEVLVAVSELEKEVSLQHSPPTAWRLKETQDGSSANIGRAHKITVPLLVAVIGMGGAIAAAIWNWDKLLPFLGVRNSDVIAVSIPEGMTLRDAIETVAQQRQLEARFDSSCSKEILDKKFDRVQKREGKNVAEVIQTLDSRLRVDAPPGKGFYEIHCS